LACIGVIPETQAADSRAVFCVLTLHETGTHRATSEQRPLRVHQPTDRPYKRVRGLAGAPSGRRPILTRGAGTVCAQNLSVAEASTIYPTSRGGDNAEDHQSGALVRSTRSWLRPAGPRRPALMDDELRRMRGPAPDRIQAPPTRRARARRENSLLPRRAARRRREQSSGLIPVAGAGGLAVSKANLGARARRLSGDRSSSGARNVCSAEAERMLGRALTP